MNLKVAVHATLSRITVLENEAQILQIDQYETFTVSLKFIHLVSVSEIDFRPDSGHHSSAIIMVVPDNWHDSMTEKNCILPVELKF